MSCRTLPTCFLSSTHITTHGNKWHAWRTAASIRLPTSACTSSSQVWTSRTRVLDVSRGTLSSRESRRRAASEEELEEAESAGLLGLRSFGRRRGGLGMEAVRALIDADILVAAYQREEKFDIPDMFHDDIEEMGWDVIDVATIEKVLESAPFEAIVCTVGGGITRPDFDRDVPIKLVNAAKMAGVTRFILVSSVGVRGSLKTLDEKTVEEVAEEAVTSSKLNYTIICPGELLSAPSTDNGVLTEKSGIAGLISRADVAALILEVLSNEKSYGKTLTTIDQDKLLPPTSSEAGVEPMSL